MKQCLSLLAITASLLLCAGTPARAEDGSGELAYAWDVIHDLVTGIFVGGPADPNNPHHIAYHYARSELVTIDGKKLGLRMARVTQDAAYSFDKTKMHCLHRELVEGHWTGTNEEPKRPTFISYLGADSDRLCDFTSGQEERLETWIWAQADNSIEPLAIYKQSLALNAGNIWNAILTVHNTMRDNARWWDAERYHYESTDERQARYYDKFIDIRGELEQRGPKFVGDHFGSWYRLWGVMLYRLNAIGDDDFLRGVRAQKSHASFEKFARWLKGKFYDWKSAAVFTAEEYRKKIIHNDDDIGKLKIDLAGGRASSWLVSGLWHPKLASKAD